MRFSWKVHGRWTTIIIVWVLCIDVQRGGAAKEIDWEGDAQNVLEEALKTEQNWGVAKNVILFIGDGMGISTVTSSRIYDGQQQGKSGEEHELIVDKFPHVALSKTYDSTHQTADSSSTATAIMCGAKAPYGTVGMTQNTVRGKCEKHNDSKKPNTQKSILEWSLDEGKAVGIVTNTRITHATPSSAYAHAEDRDWEANSDIPQEALDNCTHLEDIASQLVTKRPRIRVLLGGGRSNFFNNTVPDLEYGEASPGRRTDGRDLVQEWITEKKEKGLSNAFVWNETEFDNVDPNNTEYLLGLFQTGHMQFEIDRPFDKAGQPSLTSMTEKALKILMKQSDDKGFFLLVEGGRIDHGHHASNAIRALNDTVEFMSAIQKALDMTNDKDTLMVVTADHSHVFTMGGYSLRGNPILGTVDQQAFDEAPAVDNATYLTLMYANGPGPTRQLNLTKIDTEDKEFRQTVAVQVTYETHGGEDVAIYARGPMAHLFQGTVEQNYIAHVLGYASCVGRNKKHCETGARQDMCPPTSDGTALLGQQMSVFFCLVVCLCLIVI